MFFQERDSGLIPLKMQFMVATLEDLGLDGWTPSFNLWLVPSTSSVEHNNLLGIDQLVKLEKKLSNEEISLLRRRYDDGYDLDTDTVYSQWKNLKDLIDSGVSCNGQGSCDDSSNSDMAHSDTVSAAEVTPSIKISSSLKKCLSKPMLHKLQKCKQRSVASTLHLPKHMTGDEFIEIMEEKERKKQEEIEKKYVNRKEKRKKERERIMLETRIYYKNMMS